MAPFSWALVIVVTITCLITVTLFFTSKAKYQNKQGKKDFDLYLSKFTKWTGWPTVDVFIAFLVLATIIDSLEIFFLPWPFLVSVSFLLLACFIGTVPIWIVVGILYIIEANRETDNKPTPAPVNVDRKQSVNNHRKKVSFKLFFVFLKKGLKERWVSLSKSEKKIGLGWIIFLLTNLTGSFIQINQPEGQRNIIAAILTVISYIAIISVYYELIKSFKKKQKAATKTQNQQD